MKITTQYVMVPDVIYLGWSSFTGELEIGPDRWAEAHLAAHLGFSAVRLP